MLNKSSIASHLKTIHHRIALACAQAGRDVSSVQLLAVSKTFGVDAIEHAIQAGQLTFGENYVAEGIHKIKHFNATHHSLEWHMIGQVQSNKTRDIALHFDWVHAVDRIKIAQRLNDQRPAEFPPLQTCIAVNISNEPGKSGVNPEKVFTLAEQISSLPGIQFRGLMCIPEPTQGLEKQRKAFATMRNLLNDLQKRGFSADTLSMGMSEDLEAAILEGATIIRIGRGIFGTRDYATQSPLK